MHALVFLGGAPFLLPDKLDADLVIAADRGWDNALANGYTPDLLVGDMDSISAVPDGVETICVPAQKDDTDAQLAIECAIGRGADRITLAGQLSGRADHTLSALFMLENLHRRGIAAVMVDDRNRVRVAQDECVELSRCGYRYFGVLSLGTTVYSEQGCRYEVDRRTLHRSDPYAVSNEITAERARITVTGDPVFVVESERE